MSKFLLIQPHFAKKLKKCMKNSEFAGKLRFGVMAIFASQKRGAHVDIEGVLVKFSPSANGF